MWRACWSNVSDQPFLTANPELVTANRGLVEAGQTFVDADFMRQGIARGLAGACFRALRKQGAREVFLSANCHAMGYDESVGFRLIDPAFQPSPQMVRPLFDPLGSLR